MKFLQKITAVSIAAIVIFSLSGCNFENLLGKITNANADYQSQPASTQPLKKPPKNLDAFAHSYNNIKNENVKQLYTTIDEYANNIYSTKINAGCNLKELEITEALEAYKNDHPEIFWISNEYRYYDMNNSTYIELSYIIDGPELKTAKSEFDVKIKNILSKAPQNASDYDLELYVNNYLIDNCKYDEKSYKDNKDTGSNHAYGAIVEGIAVCEGYSRAFQLLCNKLGIDCVTINGTVEDGNHAWNCVNIEGEWYQADITWNDVENDDLVSKNDYLNLTDKQMYENHTASKLYSECTYSEYDKMENWCNNFVPVCNGTEYNYYRQSGVVLTDINDSNNIKTAIAEAAVNGESFFSIVIDDKLDYKETAESIIYDGYLAEWIDGANLYNWYSPKLNNTFYIYKKETIRVLTCELEYIE